MKEKIKLLGLAFLTWIVPFVVSFFFYSPEGELVGDLAVFKEVMYLTGMTTGAFVLAQLFKTPRPNPLQFGIKVGLGLFFFNLLLDFLILLPMSKMSVPTYVSQIGLAYVSLIVVSVLTGFVAQKNQVGQRN